MPKKQCFRSTLNESGYKSESRSGSKLFHNTAWNIYIFINFFYMLNRQKKAIERNIFQLAYGFLKHFSLIKKNILNLFKTLDPYPDSKSGSRRPLNRIQNTAKKLIFWKAAAIRNILKAWPEQSGGDPWLQRPRCPAGGWAREARAWCSCQSGPSPRTRRPGRWWGREPRGCCCLHNARGYEDTYIL